jgi:hypothetical protein
MMGVDDMRAGQSPQQTRREGIGRVAAPPADGTQRTASQATWLALDVSMTRERDQLAIDLACQGSCELERVALAAAV